MQVTELYAPIIQLIILSQAEILFFIQGIS